jgi:nitrite reductase/ring-hydroxylating ferredoxin subunit
MPEGGERDAVKRTVGKEEEKRHRVEDQVANSPKIEWYVGKTSGFAEGDRKVFQLGNREVGVFRRNGLLYAYENLCLHQGGPVCEGLIIGKVEPIVAGDQRIIGERFSDDEVHIVCPWHGYEYDIETGACTTDRRLRLRSYEVVQRGEDVYVLA